MSARAATASDISDFSRYSGDFPVPFEVREAVACYQCGSTSHRPACRARDYLTGKPGTFTFVTCSDCALVYQHPRIPLADIKAWHGKAYMAHRKKTRRGLLTRFCSRASGKHDRDKADLVQRYGDCDGSSRVLDVGCGAGTFLALMQSRYDCAASGVDFVDLSRAPAFADGDADFNLGTLCEARLPPESFDVVTMWHFLQHDYDPVATLEAARRLLKPQGVLIIEVPRLDSLTWAMYGRCWPGWQAPQHTAAYTKHTLLQLVRKAGLRVEDHLAYGAFPAYFYLFAGAAFRLLRGRGLNLARAIYPYFPGRILLAPLLLFEKRLNLAMQTVVCTRGEG